MGLIQLILIRSSDCSPKWEREHEEWALLLTFELLLAHVAGVHGVLHHEVKVVLRTARGALEQGRVDTASAS